MACVKLDTMEYDKPEFQDYLKSHDIQTSVVTCEGPNNQPIVQYFSSWDVLCNMIWTHWGDEDLYKQIEDD